MAAKKKKKAATSNPARGFATTSIASKAKTDSTAASSNVSEAGSTQPATPAEADVDHNRQANDRDVASLSPAELEAHLEQNELQLLNERIGPKVLRESSRTLTKLKTERRVLIAQANILRISDWLQNEAQHELAVYIEAHVNSNISADAQRSTVRSFSREDLMAKLWALQSILVGLYFPQQKIEQALKWICVNGFRIAFESLPWGLTECLDWLLLQSSEDELSSFERMEKQQAVVQFHSQSPDQSHMQLRDETMSSRAVDSNSNTDSSPRSMTEVSMTSQDSRNKEDEHVSDLDSDLEPTEMVTQYVSIKTRLFRIDPELLETPQRKPRKATPSTPKPTAGPEVRKLRQQLSVLENDVLFDSTAADTAWSETRSRLLQELASRRRLGIDSPKGTTSKARKPQDSTLTKLPSAFTTGAVDKSDESDEDGLFGEIFAAESEVSGDVGSGNASVRIQNFEETKGASARRILEDTLKTKDTDARLDWKMISPTTYACRYSVTITWMKNQEIVVSEGLVLPGVRRNWSSAQKLHIQMTEIATPSEKQAESYVATVALFNICAVMGGDDKAYIRLSPAWRDLYKKFLELKKDHEDSQARQTLKDLRQLIEDQAEEEADDEVVLTHNFLRRAKGAMASPKDSHFDRPTTLRPDAESIKAMWTQKTMSAAYQQMSVHRAKLPMFGFRNAVIAAVETNPVTILCGETGCGKSTQLPAYIIESELSQGKYCKVCCTEPRRISAISLAQRVSEEMGEPKNAVGTSASLVGYAIRLESNVTVNTRLVYATVGIVLRMLESPNGIDDMTHLIIDEVHERSIDTDFLLVILRSLMVRRPDLKVVLMSATVDAQKFSSYLGNAPILNVPGRTFPVQTRYLEDAIELTNHKEAQNNQGNEAVNEDDEEDATADTKSGIPTSLTGYSVATRNTLASYDEYQIDYHLIINLILKISTDPQHANYSKAFLIFLPGIAEIRQLNEMVLNHSGFSQDWWILPLHSTIASEDQQQAFVVPPTGIRKLVLSTNIAETGVTIPDITCVIDTGKHKEMRFDERRQLSRLVQSFISRANAKQRRGRAGRVQEGLCFHLFTKFRHDELMAPQQTPEMLRLSLQDLVMRTKICKLGDIEETLSQALDPPSSKNIRRAIDALVEVDALASNEELTAMGSQLAKLPLDAHLGKLVLLSAIFSCVDAALTIAAILSSKSPFIQPFGAKQRADTVRLGFLKGDSDLLTAYNAYNTWKAVCMKPGAYETDFCRKNFLSPQNLHSIEDLKGQLLTALLDTGLLNFSAEDRKKLSRARTGPSHRSRTFITVPDEYDQFSDNELLISTLIAASFHPHVLTRDGKGWRNIANNAPISIHPSSVLRLSLSTDTMTRSLRDHVLLSYYSILQSSSRTPSAHNVTPIPILPFLMLAADVDFKTHAKVLVVDGNRLRYSVKDAKTVVLLKYLRKGLRGLVDKKLKDPRTDLGRKDKEWRNVFLSMFQKK